MGARNAFSGIRAGVLTGLIALAATGIYASPAGAARHARAPRLSSSGTTLHWTAVPGATRYRLNTVSPSGSEQNVYLGEVLSYTTTGAAQGTRFRVRSRAPHLSGWSNAMTVRASEGGGAAEGSKGGGSTEGSGAPEGGGSPEGGGPPEGGGKSHEESELTHKQAEELELKEGEELARLAPAGIVSPTGPFDCAGLTGSQCEYQYFGCLPPLCSTNFAAPEPLPAGTERVGPLANITSAAGFEALSTRIHALHAEGRHLALEAPGEDHAQLEYDLATFFLFDDGHDYISETGDPGWSGWFAHFGFTVQGIRKFAGVWSRSTSEGWALVALPGTPTQTITLPYTMSTPAGYRVSSVTLSGGQGVVLQCNPIPSRGDCPGYGSYGEKEEVPAQLNPFPFG